MPSPGAERQPTGNAHQSKQGKLQGAECNSDKSESHIIVVKYGSEKCEKDEQSFVIGSDW